MAECQIRPVCSRRTGRPALVLWRSPEDLDAERRTARSRDNGHGRDRKPGGQAQRGGGSEEDHGLPAPMGLCLGAGILTQAHRRLGAERSWTISAASSLTYSPTRKTASFLSTPANRCLRSRFRLVSEWRLPLAPPLDHNVRTAANDLYRLVHSFEGRHFERPRRAALGEMVEIPQTAEIEPRF